jgi:hypothetical protein
MRPFCKTQLCSERRGANPQRLLITQMRSAALPMGLASSKTGEALRTRSASDHPRHSKAKCSAAAGVVPSYNARAQHTLVAHARSQLSLPLRVLASARHAASGEPRHARFRQSLAAQSGVQSLPRAAPFWARCIDHGSPLPRIAARRGAAMCRPETWRSHSHPSTRPEMLYTPPAPLPKSCPPAAPLLSHACLRAPADALGFRCGAGTAAVWRAAAIQMALHRLRLWRWRVELALFGAR